MPPALLYSADLAAVRCDLQDAACSRLQNKAMGPSKARHIQVTQYAKAQVDTSPCICSINQVQPSRDSGWEAMYRPVREA